MNVTENLEKLKRLGMSQRDLIKILAEKGYNLKKYTVSGWANNTYIKESSREIIDKVVADLEKEHEGELPAMLQNNPHVVKKIYPDANERTRRSDLENLKLEPGYNAKMLSHSLRVANLPMIDYTNVQQLSNRAQQYFEICVEDDMKPDVVGLALSFGVDKQTVRDWMREESDRAFFLKRVHALIEHQMVGNMQNGKLNPVVGIFLSKNHFGYKDNQDINLTPVNPFGQHQSREEIERRYLDSIVVDENSEE